MQRLEGAVKNYAWGKLGSSSEVNRLCSADLDFQSQEDQPYAELWMGTHPMGPARIRGSEVLLSKYLNQIIQWKNGTKPFMENFHLPFILKIMSVRKSLSLQVHPTKEQAKRLHKLDPVNYPDENHKPELALALTTFELLCGFRPAMEIYGNIKAIGELQSLLPNKIVENLLKKDAKQAKEALKQCFAILFHTKQERITDAIDSIVERLSNCSDAPSFVFPEKRTIDLFLQLNDDFPGDVACLGAFFLNHLVLRPGQACYYDANEIHAYLSGDCVECVSNSNNTIRGGMTPKYKDIETFLDVLSYEMVEPSSYVMTPTKFPGNRQCLIFKPNCPDFCLHQIEVNGLKRYDLPIIEECSILIVIDGRAIAEEDVDCQNTDLHPLSRGDVLFLPENHKLALELKQTPFLAYRALRNNPDREIKQVTNGKVVFEL